MSQDLVICTITGRKCEVLTFELEGKTYTEGVFKGRCADSAAMFALAERDLPLWTNCYMEGAIEIDDDMVGPYLDAQRAEADANAAADAIEVLLEVDNA